MIKEEEATKNKNHEVNDAHGKLEEEDDAQHENRRKKMILRWTNQKNWRKS